MEDQSKRNVKNICYNDSITINIYIYIYIKNSFYMCTSNKVGMPYIPTRSDSSGAGYSSPTRNNSVELVYNNTPSHGFGRIMLIGTDD